LIALEPEAASIYCQYLPTKKLKGAERGFSMSEEGTQYMVVDNGGNYNAVIYIYIYTPLTLYLIKIILLFPC
jgi:hypothetical protein